MVCVQADQLHRNLFFEYGKSGKDFFIIRLFTGMGLDQCFFRNKFIGFYDPAVTGNFRFGGCLFFVDGNNSIVAATPHRGEPSGS